MIESMLTGDIYGKEFRIFAFWEFPFLSSQSLFWIVRTDSSLCREFIFFRVPTLSQVSAFAYIPSGQSLDT